MVVMERGFIIISYNEASVLSASLLDRKSTKIACCKAVGHPNRFWAACKRGDLNL